MEVKFSYNDITYTLSRTDNTGNYFYRLLTANGNQLLGFSVYMNPTDNCQLFCISNAYPIIDAATNMVNGASVFKLVFHELRKQMGKAVCFIDIPESKVLPLKKLLGEKESTSIIGSTPYHSTNGSRMHVLLLSIGHFGY